MVVGAAPVDVHAKERKKASKADKKRRKKVVKVVQKYVELGESLFHAGDHAEAARMFRKAEQALADAGMDVPAGLYRSVARCHDQAGDVTKALAAYGRFLEAVDSSQPKMTRRIKEANDAVQRLERTLKRTSFKFTVKPASARLIVDGQEIGDVPDAALPVSPGMHTVALSAEGHEPMTLELEVGPGASVPVVATLARLATAEAEAPAEPREVQAAPDASHAAAGGTGWVPWALAVSGASIGLGALVMQGSAVSSASKAQGQADEGGVDQGRVDDLHGEAVTAQFMAVGLGLTSLALLGGATWMWLGDTSAASLQMTPLGAELHATF